MTAGWEVLNEDVPILTHPPCFLLFEIFLSVFYQYCFLGGITACIPLTIQVVDTGIAYRLRIDTGYRNRSIVKDEIKRHILGEDNRMGTGKRSHIILKDPRKSKMND